MQEIKEFAEFIIKKLVTKSDEVSVSSKEDANSTLIEVKVAQEDMGRVIGHEGNRIKSIRSITSAVAAKHNKKIRINLLE